MSIPPLSPGCQADANSKDRCAVPRCRWPEFHLCERAEQVMGDLLDRATANKPTRRLVPLPSKMPESGKSSI